MIIVRETLPLMNCGFCIDYYNADDRFKATEASAQRRTCLLIKKVVTARDTSCKNFKAAPFFYCDRDYCWMDMVSCKARQDRQKEGCIRCGQGEMIYNFVKLNEKED